MTPTAFWHLGRGGVETEEMSCVFQTISPKHRTRFRHVAAACMLLSLPLGGCSLFEANSTTRGNPVDIDAIKQLTPGITTTADATALLGSPTTHETFDDNSWVYISQITRPRVGRLPGVLEQRVVVLNFDAGGTLRQVKVYGLKDSKAVSMQPGTTQTPGTSASVLQQLFGNVGRFNGGGGSTGPGSGSSGGGLTGN
jgi:outer membrane protein assembly factor BamE (lipoprotein component of BamABCDE complex)